MKEKKRRSRVEGSVGTVRFPPDRCHADAHDSACCLEVRNDDASARRSKFSATRIADRGPRRFTSRDAPTTATLFYEGVSGQEFIERRIRDDARKEVTGWAIEIREKREERNDRS